MSVPVDELQRRVQEYVSRHAPEIGLDAGRLAVSYVLNPGGFVNQSFRITDGSRDLHLKLSTTAEGQQALKRWFALRQVLEQHYHAPPALGWMLIPDSGAEGILFTRFVGGPPALTHGVLGDILPVLRRLNGDSTLAERLWAGAEVTPSAAYLTGLHDRFIEDLSGIREQPPDFVSAALLDWMAGEVSSLEATVAGHDAFAQPLNTPVHGDVWLNNILATPAGQWYLLDWDDMHIGDPVMDLATLTGPSATDLSPLKLRAEVERGLNAEERFRLDLLGRATLLDWIIDPLADYIDAEAAPAHLPAVRQETGRVHKAALELYRDLYQDR